MANALKWILIFMVCIGIFALIQRWMKATQWMISNLDYYCSNCGGYIYLSPWQAMIAFHSMGRKWVRCPHCGQMTWAIPIDK